MTDRHRPTVSLEGFWEGEFTLQPVRAESPAPTSGPAIEELGPSGIRIRGRDLATLLAPAYRRMTGSPD